MPRIFGSDAPIDCQLAVAMQGTSFALVLFDALVEETALDAAVEPSPPANVPLEQLQRSKQAGNARRIAGGVARAPSERKITQLAAAFVLLVRRTPMTRFHVALVSLCGVVGCQVVEVAPPAVPSAAPPPQATATAPAPVPPPPADPPAPAPRAATPVAPAPVAKPCVLAKHASVKMVGMQSSATFDSIRLDGTESEMRIVFDATHTTLTNYSMTTRHLTSKTELDPKAIAWSFDGRRQVLVDGARVLVRTGDGPPSIVEGAIVPSEKLPKPASMSEDGRFLMIATQSVLFDLEDKKAIQLENPPIAGGSEAHFRVDATGYVVFAENSRGAWIGKLTYAPSFSIAWTVSSFGAVASRDARVVLAVPRQPFAQDFVPSFSIGEKKLGPTLKASDRFAAAMCPGGNVVAILAKDTLGFYATDTGLEISHTPVSKLGAQATALTKGKNAPDIFLFEPNGERLFVRTGIDDTEVDLAP
jgi:hypothetical protein